MLKNNLFFDNKEIEKKDYYKILLIPNITWQKDIDKDSYVKVMHDIIRELNKIRNDLIWYSPITSHSKLLDFPNVRQKLIKLPTYPNSMRGHFDYFEWMKIIDWQKQDFDLIWSHLPEWTTNIVNLFNNVTNITDLPVIGYCHWTETKENAKYSKTYLLNNITGLLNMKHCGFNTQNQIDNILDEVGPYFSKDTLKELRKIMIPIYLGVDDKDIQSEVNTEYEKTIVFNHRTQQYRKWDFFLQAIKKLREKRQDFKVWTSLIDTGGHQQFKKIFGDVDWLDTEQIDDRGKYLNKLRKCCVGVLCGSRWSVSVQDGLIQGLPYIHEKSKEANELFGVMSDLDYKNIDEFVVLLDEMLSDNEFRNLQSYKVLKYSKDVMSWSNRINDVNNLINDSLSDLRSVGDKSKRKYEIVDFIKENGHVTKKQITDYLGWGRGISFTPYRHYIRLHGDFWMGEKYYVHKKGD